MESETENVSYISFRRIVFFASLLAVVFGIGGWFIWKDFKAADAPEVAVNDLMSASGEEPLATTTDGKKTSETPKVDPIKAKMPSLTRTIPVGADPASVKKINEAVVLLKDNYNYLQAWLQLGNLRQGIRDYEGAIEAWKFATVLRPKSATAFLNLGDLYGWYLHDNAKAESYLLAGVAAEPNLVYPYYKTYEFYADVLKDSSKMRKILEDGIASNPDSSQDLQTLLQTL